MSRPRRRNSGRPLNDVGALALAALVTPLVAQAQAQAPMQERPALPFDAAHVPDRQAVLAVLDYTTAVQLIGAGLVRCCPAWRWRDGRLSRPTPMVRAKTRQVSLLHVLAPMPTDFLFKPARKPGGGRDITVEDVTMESMRIAVPADLNWNPSYRYATIPPGIVHVHGLWLVLAPPVPPDRTLPHFERMTIRGVRATASRQAFAVAVYPRTKPDHIRFDDVAIGAPDGGTFADAGDWRLSKLRLAAKPVTASSGIVGL